MPELPEVETLRRDLESTVLGRRVVEALVLLPEVVRMPSADAFAQGLSGRTLRVARRRGKYLLVELDDGRVWAMHLSLEGRLLLVDAGASLQDGTRLSVTLDDGRSLRLWDKVSYATTALGDARAITSLFKLNQLGPEPTAPDFTESLLRARFAKRRGMLKPLLLDQHVIAGVGNIYADESLWRARIHPTHKVNALTDTEWETSTTFAGSRQLFLPVVAASKSLRGGRALRRLLS